MRFFSQLQIFSLAGFLLVFSLGFFAIPFAVSSQTALFQRALTIGSVGADVLALQKMLNTDSATSVASLGPGSPGSETSTFGSLTNKAVKRFQEKYASEILWPVGLSQGTGFVGSQTLKKLNALAAKNQIVTAPSSPQSAAPPVVKNPVSKTSTIPTTPAQTPPPAPLAQTASSTNPNFINLDKFISAVNSVGKKQGLDNTKLRIINDGITKAAAGSMDFRKEFAKARAKAKLVMEFPELSRQPLAFSGFFKNLLTSLGIFPATAEAQAGGQAFGGAVYYVFFCDCSGNWLVGIQSLPPNNVSLLSYYEGTQAYKNYNAPFANYLLGFYTPGGICDTDPEADCAVTIPSEGLITSTLGSAL